MNYLIFVLAGIGIIWLNRKTTEDIPFIGSAVSGVILLIWGFAIAPPHFRILVELLLIGIAFSLCVRSCKTPSERL
ncbi:MAG: hypothetical protein Kow00121_65950 [Elainellaceae cyanobacterium]